MTCKVSRDLALFRISTAPIGAHDRVEALGMKVDAPNVMALDPRGFNQRLKQSRIEAFRDRMGMNKEKTDLRKLKTLIGVVNTTG